MAHPHGAFQAFSKLPLAMAFLRIPQFRCLLYWSFAMLQVEHEQDQINFQEGAATLSISRMQSLCLATNEARYTVLEGIRHVS